MGLRRSGWLHSNDTDSSHVFHCNLANLIDAKLAGTKLPICAMMTISATCRKYVLLPAELIGHSSTSNICQQEWCRWPLKCVRVDSGFHIPDMLGPVTTWKLEHSAMYVSLAYMPHNWVAVHLLFCWPHI
jgi:hypothetical protein